MTGENSPQKSFLGQMKASFALHDSFAHFRPFMEAAARHYLDFLTASDPEPVLHFPGVTKEQVEPVPVPVALPAPAPAPTSSLRQPVYQISVKHAPGACPDLPSGFDYIDGDKSTGRRLCPNQIHRVFSQPTTIEAARRRAGQLQAVAGVVRVWIEDRSGNLRNSWQKAHGRWVRV
jgi:hypothetical protein